MKCAAKGQMQRKLQWTHQQLTAAPSPSVPLMMTPWPPFPALPVCIPKIVCNLSDGSTGSPFSCTCLLCSRLCLGPPTCVWGSVLVHLCCLIM